VADPICFLAHFASGATCVGTDRDGEAWLKVTLSRADAAALMARMGELDELFYVTLIPEGQARQGSHAGARKAVRKRTDG
jgi:hypothetical protein